MKQAVLYIKIEQNIAVTNKKVFLEDIAKLYSSDMALVHDLNRRIVKVIDGEQDQKFCFSIMKVIEMISKIHPGIQIINLGETDFILSYTKPKKPKKAMEYTKTILVGLIIFFGAAFSIMTFNEDASIDKIFENMYKLVIGRPKASFPIMEIGYSIGIAAGVVLFFNHFTKVKITKDPTPIQIEMRKYEGDLNSAIIQEQSREGKSIDAD